MSVRGIACVSSQTLQTVLDTMWHIPWAVGTAVRRAGLVARRTGLVARWACWVARWARWVARWTS